MLDTILGFFRSIWQIFTLEHPLLGVSFGTILIGFFVANLSVKILSPLLGVGGAASDLYVHVGKSVRSSRREIANRRASMQKRSSQSMKSWWNKTHDRHGNFR